jgi:hypothetical protein
MMWLEFLERNLKTLGALPLGGGFTEARDSAAAQHQFSN